MIDDLYYQRESVVDVDAAVVGISALRWTCATSEASFEEAQRIMKANRFDVLPIREEDGSTRYYYTTSTWGKYDNIIRASITYDDVLSQRTPLSAVVKAFATEARSFFFLTGENRITGLLTVGNLNCRQVRTFVFALVSELEIRLSRLLADLDFSETQLLVFLKNKKLYTTAREMGVDAAVTEFMTFGDLRSAIVKMGLHEALDYDTTEACADDLEKVNRLRNDAAHPVRTFVSAPGDAEKLWGGIHLIERLLFTLRYGAERYL